MQEETKATSKAASGSKTTTNIHTETSLDSSTRLVYEVNRQLVKPGQLTVDPQVRRVLVILDTATAIAFSRYMADKDDFRPGKLAGDMIREELVNLSYLKRRVELVGKAAERAQLVKFYRAHKSEMTLEAWAKATRLLPELLVEG